jgi:hypothetical protein
MKSTLPEKLTGERGISDLEKWFSAIALSSSLAGHKK